MESPEAAVERLRTAGVRLLQMTLVDSAAITRVKLLPIDRLLHAARSGVGWSDCWAVVCIDDSFAFVPPFDTPSGDLRLVPDLTAAVPLGARPGYGWAPADEFDQDGSERETCPRGAVRRLTAALGTRGYALKATYEIEFTLFFRDGTPAHQGPGYSTAALMPLERFALGLADALAAQGVPVETLHPEYSPGQFELAVSPSDPVTAADRLVLVRHTIRQLAFDHDLDVSFAPIVAPGGLGNGCHLHLSLWQDGRSLMTGGPPPTGLDGAGGSFTAGLLHHLPAMLALLAPSVPSYERLVPGHWSGGTACIGVENREAALRVIPGSIASRGQSANVELKVVDGSANPYLALAATIAAGTAGIDEALPVPVSVEGDPATLSEQARRRAGIQPLPRTLGEAAEAFAGWEVGRAAFGTVMHDALTAVRRREWQIYGAAESDEVVRALRFRY